MGRQAVPIFLFLLAILYGAITGAITFGVASSAEAAVTWVAPACFGLFLYHYRSYAREMFYSFERSIIGCTAVAGAYGIYQYFVMPNWDALWMTNLGNLTFGNPLPMQVRVFSTLNSPQILALFLAVGILFAMRSNTFLRFLAVPFGLVSLVLSMARTAWVGFAVALVYAIFRMNSRQRLQLLFIGLFALATFSLVLQDPNVSKAVTNRFSTLHDVSHDDSIVSRIEGHEALFQGLARYPYGLGLGSQQNGASRNPADAMMGHGGKFILQNDSSLVVLVVSLGFFGFLLAASTLFVLSLRVSQLTISRLPEAIALKAALVLLASEFLLNNIINGPAAFLTWICPRLWPGLFVTSTTRREDSQKRPFRNFSRYVSNRSCNSIRRGRVRSPTIDDEVEIEVPDPESTEEHGIRAVAHTVVNKFGILLMNAGTGILTARVLQPKGRGELAAIILWPLFLSIITTLGIPSSVIYVLKTRQGDEDENILTALFMTLLLGIIAVIAGAIFIPFWLRRQYDPTVIHAAQWFLIFTPVFALTQTGRALLEAKGLFSLSNKLQIIAPATALSALLALLIAHRLNPFSAACAYMLGTAPPFVLVVRYFFQVVRTTARVRLEAARLILSYGIRSYGVDLLGTLALQVDQVLVISLLSPAAMGAYGVILSLSRMFNLFQISVVMVLFPKAAGHDVETVLALTERSARISSMITATCCLFVSLLGVPILKLLYGKEYASNGSSLTLLLIEVTISGAVFILAQAFMALGHPGIVTVLQAIGLGLSVPMMLWLIPRLGIRGAAVSLLVSTLARFILVLLGFPLILKTRLPRLLPVSEDFHVVFRTLRKAILREA